MDIKTYKVEQYKDGKWVNAALTNPNGSFTDEFTGLIENQTQHVIDSFVLVGISSEHLRVVQE
tara:strand:+ start:1058 stop:1246 length:189 start_codon:yes stop_codon:yes gene_type:complete